MDDPDSSNEPPAPPPAGALKVELNLQTSDADPCAAGWIEPNLCALAKLAGIKDGCISLAMVDDDRMVQLNEQYAGKQGTTDVLSFDLRDDSDAPLDAEIVICTDQAQRQASMRSHDARMELLLYALHGLLHLLGYDDQTQDQAIRMHQREDELLAEAGFSPVYHTELLSLNPGQCEDAATAPGVE